MAPPELHSLGPQKAPASEAFSRCALLLPSVVIMVIGSLSGPLFTRIYFLHGGTRIWLSTFMQNCGFPIFLLPLFLSYIHKHKRIRVAADDPGTISMTGKAALASVGLGLITGLAGYMYAYGSASLPLSTSSLLVSTQGLHADDDRLAGVSRRRYCLGFFVMLGAAALYGLLMPLMELTWKSMKKVKVTHVMVLEMQVIMAVAAVGFSAVGILINKDFQAIARESESLGLGQTKYRLVLAANAVCWQLMNIGFVGVILCSSSLLAGILYALLVPLGEVVPVLVLHEKFNGGKGVSMALAIWGFVSYIYGEYRQQKRVKRTEAKVLEMPSIP